MIQSEMPLSLPVKIEMDLNGGLSCLAVELKANDCSTLNLLLCPPSFTSETSVVAQTRCVLLQNCSPYRIHCPNYSCRMDVGVGSSPASIVSGVVCGGNVETSLRIVDLGGTRVVDSWDPSVADPDATSVSPVGCIGDDGAGDDDSMRATWTLYFRSFMLRSVKPAATHNRKAPMMK